MQATWVHVLSMMKRAEYVPDERTRTTPSHSDWRDDVTDSPRDEVTLTKSSSVGVSGSASDEARAGYNVLFRNVAASIEGSDPDAAQALYRAAVDVEEICSDLRQSRVRLVGLSADVSRLTAEAETAETTFDQAARLFAKALHRAEAAEARVAVLREALVRIDADLETNNEAGSPEWIREALDSATSGAGEAKP